MSQTPRLNQAQKDLYNELDEYDQQAQYWRFKSLNIGAIDDTIRERLRFDNERLGERIPGDKGRDPEGDSENESVRSDQQSADNESNQ